MGIGIISDRTSIEDAKPEQPSSDAIQLTKNAWDQEILKIYVILFE